LSKVRKITFFVLYNIALLVIVFTIGEIIVRVKFGRSFQYVADQKLIWVAKADQQNAFVYPGHRSRASVNPKGYRLTNQRLENPEFKILTVGDSYTFGWGVNDNESWTAVMERELRSSGINVNVYNAGVPAYSTQQILDSWKREVNDNNYDMTIFGIWPSDEFRFQPEGKEKDKLVRYAWLRFQLRRSSLFTAIYTWLTFKMRETKSGNKFADKLHMSYNNFEARDSTIQARRFSGVWERHFKHWDVLSDNENSGIVVGLQFATDSLGSTDLLGNHILEKGDIYLDAGSLVDSLRNAGIEISAGPRAGHYGVGVNDAIGKFSASKLLPEIEELSNNIEQKQDMDSLLTQ